MAGKKIIMRTGEALVEADQAWSAAEPEVVIGELDGPVGYAIANLIGDQVKVRKSQHHAVFLHPRGWSYFDTLRQKLHWNEGGS